jgi:hypothetical protein
MRGNDHNAFSPNHLSDCVRKVQVSAGFEYKSAPS